MYQLDQSAYWQAQLMAWGPKVLIAILILISVHTQLQYITQCLSRQLTQRTAYG